MNIMTILFGYFILKSIFKETKPSDAGNDYAYYDDCDDYDDYCGTYEDELSGNYMDCICDF